jgi:hypothetical protein
MREKKSKKKTTTSTEEGIEREQAPMEQYTLEWFQSTFHLFLNIFGCNVPFLFFNLLISFSINDLTLFEIDWKEGSPSTII